MLPDITKRIEDKVRQTIEEHGLIAPNQHIVIGLSGGPDSMCLFHVLLRMKDAWNLTIHPVHVNHKFRPGAAEADQAYVEAVCRAAGLTCNTFEVDCNVLARQLDMTSEEAGRKARYDAFYEVAEQVAAEIAQGKALQAADTVESQKARARVKIAVAQNANDQAETVLFRLLRGTGTDGLAGISYQREERGFQVIRPLLDVYREEIEEYCAYNKLEPVTDHTNEEAIYTRNKIRLELLPYLMKDFNENIEKSLVRLAGIAAEDKEYLWRQTEEAYRALATIRDYTEDRPADHAKSDIPNDAKDRSPAQEKVVPLKGEEVVMERQALAEFHKAIRHRIIFKAFGEIGLEKDISEERIKAADAIIEKKQGPKTVQFPHGYRLTVAKGKVRFHRNHEE